MLEYSQYRPAQFSRNKKPSYRVFSAVIIFVIIIILLIIKPFHAPKPESNQKPNETQTSPTDSQSANVSRNNKLETAIETIIRNTQGTYSVYIYDLSKQTEYSIRGQTVMTAASLNKLPILAHLYHQASLNNIDLEKVITPQTEDIQDYGTGSIRYDPPNTPYSIKSLARLMIEKSDNTAAYILGDVIFTLPQIQDYIDSLGLTQTNMGDNQTSAKDIGQLLIKMYKGEITSKALTPEMLGFMIKTDFEDRIPTGVPANIKVYHKIGDEVGKIHDAGIIEAGTHPYVLVIMTTDQTDEQKTKETMANISRLVYETITKS